MAGTDIDAFLRALAPALRAVLDPRIELDIEVAVDCPRAACDSAELENLLLQGMRQLLDAMHDSGRLRLSVRPDGRQAGDGIALVLDAGRGRVLTHRLPRAERTRPATATGHASFQR